MGLKRRSDRFCVLSSALSSKEQQQQRKKQQLNMYEQKGEVGGGREDVVMVGRMERELTLPWLVSLEARALF